MSIVAARKEILCSGCAYRGPSRIAGTRYKPLVMLSLLTGLSICSWPLLLLAAPYALWAFAKPAQHICPHCRKPGIQVG